MTSIPFEHKKPRLTTTALLLRAAQDFQDSVAAIRRMAITDGEVTEAAQFDLCQNPVVWLVPPSIPDQPTPNE